MRIAIVSDIHANLTALEAVLGDLKAHVAPDLVVHGGDLVGSGAYPAEVVDLVRDLGWPGVLGNTDEMLWNDERVAEYFAPPALQPWRAIVGRSIRATLDAVGGERLDWLKTLPERWVGTDLTVVHASPGDRWRAPAALAPDDDLVATYGRLGTRAVVYGHIHWPYVRRLGALTIVNAGAVSLSYDGDPRASYVVVDDDRIAVRRVAYDVEREVAALLARRCPDAQWLAETLRTAKPVRPSTSRPP